MRPPSCDPASIRSIDAFHITPGQERVIFRCTDDKGPQAIISEFHLQRKRPQLVQGFWRKQGNLLPADRNDERGDRHRVTGLASWHVLRVHDYRSPGPNEHELLVQWCGYTKDQATWEPYAKVWESRFEIVEEYFEKQGRDLPVAIDRHESDTSDDEEADQIKEEPREIEIKRENDD
ncbi:hypothetical protein FPOA_06512 [Fusarium poae]|uniref:Chromo domain-containing protein n=1 Tax=Fusarium poae TaxID=36050 RepID=A0A1B8AZU3_FUSPO|nr:hypothetical protein FPOA_06512 [Fusarium poae]